MIMGAIIGAAVGLVIYFVQQQQKKKNESGDMLDSSIKDNTNQDA